MRTISDVIENCDECQHRENYGGSHYHCSQCGEVCGMMGHYAGEGKPFSCAKTTEPPAAAPMTGLVDELQARANTLPEHPWGFDTGMRRGVEMAIEIAARHEATWQAQLQAERDRADKAEAELTRLRAGLEALQVDAYILTSGIDGLRVRRTGRDSKAVSTGNGWRQTIIDLIGPSCRRLSDGIDALLQPHTAAEQQEGGE